jgi:hypothetical protein
MALDRDGEMCSAQHADSETGGRSSRPAEDEAVIVFWKATLVGSKQSKAMSRSLPNVVAGVPRNIVLRCKNTCPPFVETSEKAFPSGNSAPANTADTISSCTESKQHQRKRPKCLAIAAAKSFRSL